jgi:hypothetical protein
VALIPKLSCPFCRPAYAAIASTLGLGFLVNARYLFAVIAAFFSLRSRRSPFGRRFDYGR